LKRSFLFFFQKNARNNIFLGWHAWATIAIPVFLSHLFLFKVFKLSNAFK